MSGRSVVFFVTLATVLTLGSSAKLLGFFGVPSVSHQVVYRTVMLELARRGHNVTVVTTDPIKKSIENYREIDVSYSYEHWRKSVDFAGDGVGWLLRNVPEFLIPFFVSLMGNYCEMYLSDPNIKRLIDENEQFDAFITEFGPMPCAYPFAKQSNDILIGILSLSFGNVGHRMYGSGPNIAFNADAMYPYTPPFTKFQKLRLLFADFILQTLGNALISTQQQVSNKYFGSNTSDIVELGLNANLLLQHGHPSVSWPRSQAQLFVDIGGPPLHLFNHEAKSLPKDLQDFIDSAEHGVIYFSLGSNVKSSTMPERKRALFLNAFRQIKQKVLWKWETDDLPGKPDNVKVSKWLPQTDVLAHPNVKAFITQGGLQSMGEATHFTKPMIVIPFFADQELNAKKLESVGVAIKLDFETITEEQILQALKDITEDPKYKENMIKYSDLTRDQPQSPMERAIWWTEYVLRHKGAPHLRSAATDLTWYQYFMLDVLAFLAAVIGVFLYTLHFIGSRLFRLFFRKQKSKKE